MERSILKNMVRTIFIFHLMSDLAGGAGTGHPSSPPHYPSSPSNHQTHPSSPSHHQVHPPIQPVKCLEGWLPSYKSDKCLKILNIYETYSKAAEACSELKAFEDLSEFNIASTLLTIGSKQEEIFMENLLFNISGFVDNVWLGGVRDKKTKQFSWLDGTPMNSQVSKNVYTNWAFGYPISDAGRNCAELRAIDYRKQNTLNEDPGAWYNVPCSKHNLVVCQNFRTLPAQEVHYQLLSSKQEISTLKGRLGTIEEQNTELKKSLTGLKSEIAELNRMLALMIESSVTDIRFVKPEMTEVFQSRGFTEGQGFVLTGAINWDGNEAIDSIQRRKVQKFVNGQWVDVY